MNKVIYMIVYTRIFTKSMTHEIVLDLTSFNVGLLWGGKWGFKV